jgi:hypothetical protein
MWSIIANLVLKYGLAALPIIAAEWGPLIATMAFFVFLPLGHLVMGVALLVLGAFVPELPGDDTKHVITVGTSAHKIALKGNARTALLAGALVIIVGSIAEWMVVAVRGSPSG